MLLKSMKSILIIGMMASLSHGAQIQKLYGGAIKLELMSVDQLTVTHIQSAGSLGSDKGTIVPQVKLHVSIGYIDKKYDQNTANLAGNIAVNFINTYLNNNHVTFEIDQCTNFVGQTMSFTILSPTAQSAQSLKKLNAALEAELNRHGYTLNNLTTHTNYTPHLTIKKGVPGVKGNATGYNRMNSMNNYITALPQATKTFVLKQASFSLGW